MSRPCQALAVSLLAVFAFACSAPTEPLPLAPGRSERPRGGPTVPAPPDNAPPAPWERWPEVATFRLALPRAPSQHLAGDHEAETLASPEAAAYPDLGPARLLPAGSSLVERLYAPDAATPEVLFAMARPRDLQRPSPDATASTASSALAAASAAPTIAAPTGMAPSPAAWEFFVLSPDGTVQARGSLETCVRCHAEAPNDGVFGRAR